MTEHVHFKMANVKECVTSLTGDGGCEETGDIRVHHNPRNVFRHVSSLFRVDCVPNLMEGASDVIKKNVEKPLCK